MAISAHFSSKIEILRPREIPRKILRKTQAIPRCCGRNITFLCVKTDAVKVADKNRQKLIKTVSWQSQDIWASLAPTNEQERKPSLMTY